MASIETNMSLFLRENPRISAPYDKHLVVSMLSQHRHDADTERLY